MIEQYYNRKEVSNSDLSELKDYLEGKEKHDRTKNYQFGNLFDAMLTEPGRIDYRGRKFDGNEVEWEMWERAIKMKLAYTGDQYCAMIQKQAGKQAVYVENVKLNYEGFDFALLMRCKLDFDLPSASLAVDLKTTFAVNERQFRTAVEMFDYDRQAAVYMTICNYDRFAIIGVSKINDKIFKIFITKDSGLYKTGMEKFQDLALKWYLLFGN